MDKSERKRLLREANAGLRRLRVADEEKARFDALELKVSGLEMDNLRLALKLRAHEGAARIRETIGRLKSLVRPGVDWAAQAARECKMARRGRR